jgi:hypothetical protein
MQGLNQGTMELESKLPKAWVVIEWMKFLIMGDFPINLKTYGPPNHSGGLNIFKESCENLL